MSDLATTGHTHFVTPPSHLSALPDPEMFEMMLVGLILIGYRASRYSGKFK